MSTTVLEALLNAQCNFKTLEEMAPQLKFNPFYRIAKEQLDNGIAALENGMESNSVIQEEPFGEIKTS